MSYELSAGVGVGVWCESVSGSESECGYKLW